MTDAQEPQRSLWLQLLWQPQYRSRREKTGYSIFGFVIVVLVMLPIMNFEWWSDSFYWRLLWAMLLATGVNSCGSAIWLLWGRKRFPLPAADESQSAA